MQRTHSSSFFAAISLMFTGVAGAFAQSLGNCTPVDLDYICQNTELVSAVSAACGDQCIAEGQACMEACMAAQLELTSECITCFGEQVTCVVTNCLFQCAVLGDEACAQCALTYCEAGFNECAGIVDSDQDEWTNLCDCDDSNPAIHPGAVGTGSGIDNDCNGLYTTDELASCVADLNGDNVVGADDLLVFLADYECNGANCSGDFNDDGQVGASDLLAFLSEFGLFCL
jgi:hypothetical protein